MVKWKVTFKKFIQRVKQRHRRVRFLHFTTHMVGKLVLGLGIGAFFFDTLQPYVVALVIVGLLLHMPFWHHVYIKRL